MGEAMDMEPLPQERSATLATIELVFEGVFVEGNAQKLAAEYEGLVSKFLEGRRSNYRFSLLTADIEMKNLTVRTEEVRPGSILVTLAAIATIAGVAYNAVASYPQFKENFPEVRDDLNAAIEWASTKSVFKPISVDVVRRDENGILEDLQLRKW